MGTYLENNIPMDDESNSILKRPHLLVTLEKCETDPEDNYQESGVSRYFSNLETIAGKNFSAQIEFDAPPAKGLSVPFCKKETIDGKEIMCWDMPYTLRIPEAKSTDNLSRLCTDAYTYLESKGYQAMHVCNYKE